MRAGQVGEVAGVGGDNGASDAADADWGRQANDVDEPVLVVYEVITAGVVPVGGRRDGARKTGGLYGMLFVS